MSRTGSQSRLTLVMLAVSALLAPRALAQSPSKLSLEVSPKAGTIAQTFTATVTVEVPGLAGPDRYWMPDFGDFKVIDTQFQTTTTMQTDARRGKQLTTIETRRYILEAQRAGRLRVGPARVLLGGKEHQTRPTYVRVLDAGTAAAAPLLDSATDPTATGGVGAPGFTPPVARLAAKDMFLHAVADRQQVYEGEQVTVTWLLYTRSEILKFEPRPPQLDDLWSEVLYEPDSYFRYYSDEVGGVPYQVAIVSKRAVFPTRTGKVEVAPFAAEVAGLYTPLGETTALTSEPITLDVKPLPSGAPPGFDSSYVGVYSVEAEADRERLDAGEALTITVTVRGEGAIRRTSAPSLRAPGFELRAPRDFDERVETAGDLVRGERVYRYWTTPTQAGEQVIPPVTLVYFNPRTAAYERAASEPIELTVSGDPAASGRSDARRENLIGRDIRVLRAGATIGTRTTAQLYQRPWYWALFSLPILGFVGLVIVDRVREGLRKDTLRSRLRRARGRARRRFRVAEMHLRGNRPSNYFGELARVIYDFLEERVGQPVGSMTREQLGAFLSSRGFRSTTIERIQHELESCDYARFAPTAAGPDEMRQAKARVQALLRDIENQRPSKRQEAQGIGQ